MEPEEFVSMLERLGMNHGVMRGKGPELRVRFVSVTSTRAKQRYLHSKPPTDRRPPFAGGHATE